MERAQNTKKRKKLINERGRKTKQNENKTKTVKNDGKTKVTYNETYMRTEQKYKMDDQTKRARKTREREGEAM